MTFDEKLSRLNELSMKYETSVTAFTSENYLIEFCDFFEVKNKGLKLVPSPYGFKEALKELSGYDVWQPIAETTESLFGLPERVTVFDDDSKLIEELEGADGLAPFYIVFDLMFCEFDGFSLCFISGTNN